MRAQNIVLSSERYTATVLDAVKAAKEQGRVIPSSTELRLSLIGSGRQVELTGFYLTRTLAVYLAPGRTWDGRNVVDDQKDSFGRTWEFEVSSLSTEIMGELLGRRSDVALSVDLQKCEIIASTERVLIRAMPGAVKIHEGFPERARAPGKINTETGLVVDLSAESLPFLTDEQRATLFRVDGDGVRPVFLYGYQYSKFMQSVVAYYDQNKVADVPFVGIAGTPQKYIPATLLKAAMAEMNGQDRMESTQKILRILEQD